MTQEKVIKAKAHKLNKPEDGNRGKIYNYLCDQHDIEVCFRPGFLDTLFGNFLIGDEICFLHVEEEVLVATCSARVLFIDSDPKAQIKIKIAPSSELRRFNVKEEEKEPVEEEPKEEYIKKDGVAIYNKKRRKYEVFMDDEIVYASQNKTHAEAVARGDKPIPQHSAI